MSWHHVASGAGQDLEWCRTRSTRKDKRFENINYLIIPLFIKVVFLCMFVNCFCRPKISL